MPGFYEFTCPHCKRESAALDYGYGVMREDETIAWLGHPGEYRQIEQHGFTWQQAWLDGRIVRSDEMICLDCGTLHSVQKLEPPQLVDSITPPAQLRGLRFWLPLAGSVAVMLYFDSLLYGLAALVVIVLPFEWVLGRRDLRIAMQRTAAQRERWAKILEPTTRCGACGGNRFKPVGDDIHQSARDLRCPTCQTRGLSLQTVGIA